MHKEYKDEEILENIKTYYQKNGRIGTKDFVLNNGLPSGTYLRKRFGSLKKVYELCGIPVENKLFSRFKNCTDEEMLQRLKWFYSNIGFPTNRSLCTALDMPSSTMFYERFGSLRNAIIIAEIPIPLEREKYFNREKLTDEEMLSLFKYHVKKHLIDDDTLLFIGEKINDIEGIPSESAYYNRFGKIDKIYSLIGYDYYEYNREIIKKRMLNKYFELQSILGRVPDSRDIEEYSRNNEGFYSMSTYENNFGSLYNLQITADVIPTRIGRNKSNEDMISDLIWLEKELGRTPHYLDLANYDNLANSIKYTKEFGSFSEALSLAGMIPNVNTYRTKKGTKCLSYYELIITDWFEDNDIEFEKEVLYKKVVLEDTTLRRFDWMVTTSKNIYYIEMFGIIGREDYLNKTKCKIVDCKNYGINLIALYPDDLKRPLHEVFSFLFETERVV